MAGSGKKSSSSGKRSSTSGKKAAKKAREEKEREEKRRAALLAKRRKIAIIGGSSIAAVIVVGMLVVLFFSPKGVQVGDTAPDFTLEDTDGVDRTLHDTRGSPTMLVFIWTDCPHCQAEMTNLKSIYGDYSSEITLWSIGVDSRDDMDDLRDFKAEYEGTWPFLDATSSGALDDYRVKSYPTIIIIDGEGTITFRKSGQQELGTLEEELESLL